MHFEAFISSQKQDIQQHLGFIQKLYIALDEPDGVAGVAASRKRQPTLHEQILDQKSSGMVNNSPTCEIAVDCEQSVFSQAGARLFLHLPLRSTHIMPLIQNLLVITKGYGVRVITIEGQNAFVPSLC